jgi:hypothetical protein
MVDRLRCHGTRLGGHLHGHAGVGVAEDAAEQLVGGEGTERQTIASPDSMEPVVPKPSTVR